MRGEWWWPTSFAQALCLLPLHTNLHASLIKLFHKRHYNAPFHVTKRKGGLRIGQEEGRYTLHQLAPDTGYVGGESWPAFAAVAPSSD